MVVSRIHEKVINMHVSFHYKVIASFLFSVLVFFAITFSLSDNLSLVVFLFSFFLVVVFSCLRGSNYKVSEFKILMTMFFLISSCYFLYSFFSFVNYQSKAEFFIFPDQVFFYSVSDSTKEYPSLIDGLMSIVSNEAYRESYAVHVFSGTIAYISDKYLSGNSIFLQSLVVSCFAIFANIFLYKTLRYYTSKKRSFYYTLMFAFFSPVFAYSPWILRDVHVLFFYTLGFYLTHKKFNLKILVLLFAIQYILVELRFSSGIAFLFFPFFYIYLRVKGSKGLYILFVIFLPILFFIILKNVGAFNSIAMELLRYQEYTENKAASSGGLSVFIYQLPVGLKQVSAVIFSQIQPFPPWAGAENAGTLFELISTVIFAVTGIFWFYVFFTVSLSLFEGCSRAPKILNLSLVYFFVYLIANTANINPRRLLAVYPIAYTFFVFSQLYVNSRFTKEKRLKVFVLLYVVLIAFYMVLKYA